MPSAPATVVRGDGYSFRPMQTGDAGPLSAVAADERYWRYLSDGPRSPEQVTAFVDDAVARSADPASGHVWWAIEHPDTAVFLGTANLKRIGADQHRACSVGCALVPDAQGHGLGQRIGWALIALAFDTFEMHRVECTCAVENEASCHIMRDVFGMTYEGIRRDYKLTPRGWWSSHVFSILEDEFAVRDESLEARQI
jgi:ribosomal-protein-alanine N-acetyltransferase